MLLLTLYIFLEETKQNIEEMKGWKIRRAPYLWVYNIYNVKNHFFFYYLTWHL